MVTYAVPLVLGVLIGTAASHLGGQFLLYVAAIAVLVYVISLPVRLVVLLCVGFLIGDKAFAVLVLRLPGFPLYITEACIATTLALLFLKYLMLPSTALCRRNMALVRKPALMFWGVGTAVLFISVWNCIAGPGLLLPTLRNAASFYYSVFYLFVLFTFNDVYLAMKLTHAYAAIIVIMSIRFLLEFNQLLPTEIPQTEVNFFCIVAPVAVSMLFCTLPVMRHKAATLLLIILISIAVVQTDIRQGILGLICGGLCSWWLLRRFGLLSSGHRKVQFVLLALFLASVVMLVLRDDLGIRPGLDAYGPDGQILFLATPEQEYWIERVPIWDRMIERDFSDTGRREMWVSFLADMSQSWTSVVFGVGFDRLFIPDWMLEMTKAELMRNKATGVNQLDPHNSHLHLLYRIGVIGFVAYLMLIRGAFVSSFKYLREGTSVRLKYYTVGFLSALAGVGGEALVGVLFEAPHRGIPFWVLLGVSTCFPRVALENERRASNETERN